MIRLALAFLGWSVGGAAAQGMVPTAPVVEACGGLRITVDAEGSLDADEMEIAAKALSARLGRLAPGIFDYAEVRGARIELFLPPGTEYAGADPQLLPAPIDFGFHAVERHLTEGQGYDLQIGQILRAMASDPSERYVLTDPPFLTQRDFADAYPARDAGGQPAIGFRLTPEAEATFARFTTDNVGNQFAIVQNDAVLSAPRLRSPIRGGEGLISGRFTDEDAARIAMQLRGGLPPITLKVISATRVDGSDPSADFCP